MKPWSQAQSREMEPHEAPVKRGEAKGNETAGTEPRVSSSPQHAAGGGTPKKNGRRGHGCVRRRTVPARDPQGCCGGAPEGSHALQHKLALCADHFLASYSLKKTPKKEGVGFPGPGTGARLLAHPPALTRSFWMDRMRLRAASQLARLPVMTMVSRVAVLCWKVNFGVAFFPNLQGERPVRS